MFIQVNTLAQSLTVAAVGGILGAKLFHLIEYPDQFVVFIKAPSLNAFLGGLTIYGGLIIGGHQRLALH